jgi:phage tail-like protein
MAKSSGRESDPLIGFQFSLECAGMITGFFSEVGGVGSENEVIEHKIVDKAGHESVQKLPGRLKWTDISLKRGITDNMQVWEWRQMVVDGQIGKARKNCTITMFDRDYKPAAKWDLFNAWPSKVTGPSFKSDSNEFGIEEVTLVHEGMKRSKV